jgi:hypothetical protein
MDHPPSESNKMRAMSHDESKAEKTGQMEAQEEKSSEQF